MDKVTSQKSRLALRGGFSLMEIIVVLCIAAIVFGAAAFLITTPKLEQKIRESHTGIENLALQARAMSYSYQQPFLIELREGEVRMMPLAQPEDEIEQDDLGEEFGTPASLAPLDSMSWPRVFKIDPEYALSVRRWNSYDFKLVRNNVVERWIHQPNSPCEPLAIQLESREGNALLSRSFHPLSGRASDEEMAIGNQE